MTHIALLGLTVADLGGSNSLIFIIMVVSEIGLAIRGAGEYVQVGWVGNAVKNRRSRAF